MAAFNSLSRDHDTWARRVVQAAEAFNSLSRDHSRSTADISLQQTMTFQLPLSGSHEVVDEEKLKMAEETFNSLSRDHMLLITWA